MDEQLPFDQYGVIHERSPTKKKGNLAIIQDGMKPDRKQQTSHFKSKQEEWLQEYQANRLTSLAKNLISVDFKDYLRSGRPVSANTHKASRLSKLKQLQEENRNFQHARDKLLIYDLEKKRFHERMDREAAASALERESQSSPDIPRSLKSGKST